MSQVTEQELISKAVAPRVTLEQLEATIASEYYFTGLDGVDGHFRGEPAAVGVKDAQALTLLTFCVLVLQNGFTVHGVSGVASPENYNKEIGERIARQNAVSQIWPLLGYELKTKLFLSQQGADLSQGAGEPKASLASRVGAGEATDAND